MTNSEMKERRGCGCLPRSVVIGLLAGLILLGLGDSCVSYESGVWERSGSGGFKRVEGREGGALTFQLSHVQSTTNSSRSLSTMSPDRVPGQPMRLSSVTIVDLTDSAVSRRAAHALLEELEAVSSVQRVDIRRAGDGATWPLGDQIVSIEILADESFALGLGRTVDVDLYVSHVPEFGWGEDPYARQRAYMDGRIETEAMIFGSPLISASAAAEAVAGGFELGEALEEFGEKESPAAAYPVELLDPSPDLGDAAVALSAMGIEGAPVFQGTRHSRKGEAMWRLEAPDATDRIEPAIAALEEQGWTRVKDIGSRGVDRKTHLAVARKGRQFLRWQYQENRENRLQREWWTSTNGGPQTHHVEGEALPPVVWLHYRNERTVEELQELLGRAEAAGVRQAFVENLNAEQLEELGLER